MYFYIVPTPIGNLGDISYRAVEVLNNVDYIIAEDTRITEKLLSAYSIKYKEKIIIYNDHSNQIDREKILALLNTGKSLALVSDAGTPMISDPGYKLITFLIESQKKLNADFKITSLPGASALTTALTLSGLPTDKFMFCGFIPHELTKRDNLFQELELIRCTLIFFETAKRLIETLKIALDKFGDRNVVICRELTKIHEETIRGSVSEIIEYYKTNTLKGELTLLIDGYKKEKVNDDIEKYPAVMKLIDKMIKDKISIKTIIEYVLYTFECDVSFSKNQLYNHILNLKSKHENSE